MKPYVIPARRLKEQQPDGSYLNAPSPTMVAANGNIARIRFSVAHLFVKDMELAVVKSSLALDGATLFSSADTPIAASSTDPSAWNFCNRRLISTFVLTMKRNVNGTIPMVSAAAPASLGATI